jgi:hypothetical protein
MVDSMIIERQEPISFQSLDDLESAGGRLGKGSFASVSLVKHKNHENLLALKIIDLSTS